MGDDQVNVFGDRRVKGTLRADGTWKELFDFQTSIPLPTRGRFICRFLGTLSEVVSNVKIITLIVLKAIQVLGRSGF